MIYIPQSDVIVSVTTDNSTSGDKDLTAALGYWFVIDISMLFTNRITKESNRICCTREAA